MPETDETLLYKLKFERNNQPLYPEEALAVFKSYLEKKYKDCYDPHEEFVCPPHVTIDQIIREIDGQ